MPACWYWWWRSGSLTWLSKMHPLVLCGPTHFYQSKMYSLVLCAPIHFYQRSFHTKLSRYVFLQVINGTAYKNDETYHYRQAQEIAHAWQAFFEPAGLGSMPEDIQYYCCGQFLVDINRIQRLPREFYLKVFCSSGFSSSKAATISLS